MTIGLGTSENIDSLRVIWPDDKTQKLTNIQANQFLTFNQSDATEIHIPFKKEKIKTLLTEITNNKL